MNNADSGDSDNHTDSTDIRWNRVKTLFNMGIVLVCISGVLATVRDRIALVLSKDGLNQFPMLHLSVFLLLLTLLLIVGWISVNSGEIQMLQRCFKNVVLPTPTKAFYIVAGIALLLGTMGYFSDNILVFSGMFTVYNVLAAWGQWTVNEKCRQMHMKVISGSELSDSRRRELEAIEGYYLKRPHFPRHMIILFVSFASVVLSLVSKLHAGTVLETHLIIIAYIVMILNLLVSELVIMVWRIRRDRLLGEVYR